MKKGTFALKYRKRRRKHSKATGKNTKESMQTQHIITTLNVNG